MRGMHSDGFAFGSDGWVVGDFVARFFRFVVRLLFLVEAFRGGSADLD